MRSAIDTSRTAQFSKEEFKNGDMSVLEKAISHHHAFYMATLGGAKGECSYYLDLCNTLFKHNEIKNSVFIRMILKYSTHGFVLSFFIHNPVI